ncbi:MAG: hypothetical protein GX620_15250 [Chloroflexi bacterium]|nr:hypothetical protein [Chloroflexota bacterium]
MSDHISYWLDAYRDGELSGTLLETVEAHLAECAECRRELDLLDALYSVLQDARPPVPVVSEDDFVLRVRARLNKSTGPAGGMEFIKLGWRVFPFALGALWAFGQSVLLVTSGLLYAQRAFPVAGAVLAPLSYDGPAAGNILQSFGAIRILDGVVHVVWGGLSKLSPLVLTAAFEIGLLVSVGLLWWSWIASWWARRQHLQMQAEDRT